MQYIRTCAVIIRYSYNTYNNIFLIERKYNICINNFNLIAIRVHGDYTMTINFENFNSRTHPKYRNVCSQTFVMILIFIMIFSNYYEKWQQNYTNFQLLLTEMGYFVTKVKKWRCKPKNCDT